MSEFFVVWDYSPILKVANDLNPDGLRHPQVQNKVCTAKEFVGAVITCTPKSKSTIIRVAMRCFSMGQATAYRYLERMVAARVVTPSGVLCWK